MTYDVEQLLSDVETFLKANLNTKISSITTEKNDGITLSTVSSSAYFFQTLNDEVTNWDPFIFYGLKSVSSDGTGIGPGTLKTYTLTVVLSVVDNGQDFNIGKRVLRYSRALEEVFEQNYNSIGDHGVKFKVQTLEPVSFQLVNSTETHRAVGVDLIASLA